MTGTTEEANDSDQLGEPVGGVTNEERFSSGPVGVWAFRLSVAAFTLWLLYLTWIAVKVNFS